MEKPAEVLELEQQNRQLEADIRRLIAENIYLSRAIREMKEKAGIFAHELLTRPINSDITLILKSA